MIDSLKTKRGEREDVDAISRIVRNSYAKWIPLIDREPLPMSANYEDTIEKNRFDLFYQNEQLVALLEIINNKNHMLIENICVTPALQRKGVGKFLLNYAENIAKNARYRVVRLNTNSLFEGNVKLYLRCGYIIDWEKPIDAGVHVHMYKIITA